MVKDTINLPVIFSFIYNSIKGGNNDTVEVIVDEVHSKFFGKNYPKRALVMLNYFNNDPYKIKKYKYNHHRYKISFWNFYEYDGYYFPIIRSYLQEFKYKSGTNVIMFNGEFYVIKYDECEEGFKLSFERIDYSKFRK
jgi:hypothetical protein